MSHKKQLKTHSIASIACNHFLKKFSSSTTPFLISIVFLCQSEYAYGIAHFILIFHAYNMLSNLKYVVLTRKFKQSDLALHYYNLSVW